MSDATLVKAALCLLAVAAAAMHRLARGAEARAAVGPDSAGHRALERRYFSVFLLAAFADWLQGPYVYKLYSHYGYTEQTIAVLYVVGFLSSVTFGTVVGSLADRLGRRRLCAVYCALYSLCCLTKVTPNFYVLLLGRVFGGISTSILFSTFEAWYIHEHLRAGYPPHWISLTMARATFYNAILAILAGVLANTVAETLVLGPVSPFLVAVPCLVVAGGLVHYKWEENVLQFNKASSSYFRALGLIFDRGNRSMLQLGTVQAIYEAVMYTFVFLWTPVLLPMSPPLGLVFSCFMVCVMVGSSLYAYLASRGQPAQRALTGSVALALVSLGLCSVATSRGGGAHNAPLCFLAFLAYEVSVGLYFPAVGYLRSRALPEEYRASITNWFRVPMNFLVCCSLLFLRDRPASESDATESHSSHTAFLVCSCLLVVAAFVSTSFSRSLAASERKSVDEIAILS